MCDNKVEGKEEKAEKDGRDGECRIRVTTGERMGFNSVHEAV